MNKQEIFREHVLENIDATDDDLILNTDEEKVNYLYNSFHSAYKLNLDRYKKRSDAIESWLRGLPCSINTLIYNDDIVSYLEGVKLLDENASDDKVCKTVEDYWIILGKTIDGLFKEFKVEKPTDIKIILSNSKIRDNLLYLPEVKYDRKTYQKVADILNMIGGKWKGGNTKAFVFDKNPSNLIKRYLNGEDVNFKKKFQFFATPQSLAEKIVSMANLMPEDSVLEPSAGQGALIKEINKKGIEPSYFEIMDINLEVLKENGIKGNFLGKDFLSFDSDEKFDKIIANPPFSKNQDIDHVMKMYSHLKKGGKLVSIMSKHWTFANDKKSKSFKDFVENNGHYETIDSGTFKESGTNIETTIVILEKPIKEI